MQKFHESLVSTQRECAPGTVPNNGGGFSFALDKWGRLDRFLILGTEGGTYYVGERALTRANCVNVATCIAEDAARTVAHIVEISSNGRAPKNDPALFALAMCLKAGVPAARLAIPQVARTGTHFFHLAQYYKGLGGGWGRATKRAFGSWYTDRSPDSLAYQAIKYQQRDGWSHRDLLRLAHVKPSNDTPGAAVLNWMVKGWEGVGAEPHPDEVLRKIWAFERAKVADRKELIKLILDHGLPHECVPNEAKGDPEIWAAMLPSMGLTALVRNLGKMTSVGLLAPLSAATKRVCDVLADTHAVRNVRIHPLQILVGLNTYRAGQGVKGNLVWAPVPQIINALDAAFYTAFKAIEPTNKRTMLCLDVSGSMNGGVIAGMAGVTPRVGSMAMAMVTAAVGPQHYLTAFSNGIVGLNIKPGTPLHTACQVADRLPFSDTDCALPFQFAQEQKLEVDTFIVYTDSETNANSVHPHQALRNYRQHSGIAAKLVVVGMTATEFTIADPDDAGMLDVVGFDTTAPAVIADFARD